MTTAYAKVTSAPLPMDPWGRPYVWDENEGEGGGCGKDSIRSAGPDRTGSTGDDKSYSVPLSGYTGCQ